MKFSLSFIVYIILLLTNFLDLLIEAETKLPTLSTTRQRLVKELKDIGSQELLPCYPFNVSDNEVGIRLHPTGNLFEWSESVLCNL